MGGEHKEGKMLKFEVKFNGIAVTAADVQDTINAIDGHPQFILYSNGLLRLRINHKGKYYFYELNRDYEAFAL
jgi:hypothetical protein